MSGTPVRRARRAREARMFDDPEFWNKIFDGYAEFGSLPKMAKEIEVPYKKLYHKITTTPDLNERYNESRQAYAEMTVDEIKNINDKLEIGQIDPASAKTLINSKQWIASKYSPIAYGERQTIDMQVTDATQLHLEALRKQMKDITPKPKEIDD
jgi:hypothetical protein